MWQPAFWTSRRPARRLARRTIGASDWVPRPGHHLPRSIWLEIPLILPADVMRSLVVVGFACVLGMLPSVASGQGRGPYTLDELELFVRQSTPSERVLGNVRRHCLSFDMTPQV